MIPVKAQFIFYPNVYQNGTCKSDGKAKYINRSEGFVAHNIAKIEKHKKECNFHEYYYRNPKYCSNCGIKLSRLD